MFEKKSPLKKHCPSTLRAVAGEFLSDAASEPPCASELFLKLVSQNWNKNILFYFSTSFLRSVKNTCESLFFVFPDGPWLNVKG